MLSDACKQGGNSFVRPTIGQAMGSVFQRSPGRSHSFALCTITRQIMSSGNQFTSSENSPFYAGHAKQAGGYLGQRLLGTQRDTLLVGVRHAQTQQSGGRKSCTVEATTCANGRCLLPFVIYKGRNMNTSWCLGKLGDAM